MKWDCGYNRKMLGASTPGSDLEVMHGVGAPGLTACVEPTCQPEVNVRGGCCFEKVLMAIKSRP